MSKIKNIYGNKPKWLNKLLTSLKALVGTISGAAYLQDKPDLAFYILIAGGFIDFALSMIYGKG